MPNKLIYRGLWMDGNAHQWVNDAVIEASRLARELNQDIAFTFTGILIVAHPDSQAANLIAAYNESVKALRP